MARVILLDTCSLLWLVTNRAELSPAAERAIDDARQVFVSAASAFEIGTKHRQGKLKLHLPPDAFWTAAVERLELLELPITSGIALAASALPTTILVEGRSFEHKDPGDRFIVASAAAHRLTIVTPDRRIAAYPHAAVVW